MPEIDGGSIGGSIRRFRCTDRRLPLTIINECSNG
jgi:hypothetical protein